MKVRFAPSPTGSLHIGNALGAVANRNFGGTFLLRIDDTDPARNIEGGEEAILEDLRWLGIDWDEGPVRQSERGERYREAAAGLPERFQGVQLLRPDGSATYQLASVVDDIDFGVTHVIRGSDHRPNEPLHRALTQALGAAPPQYIHFGLILGPDGKKLAKRHGATKVEEFRREGYLPEAMANYLSLIGWSPGTEEEVFTLDELVNRWRIDHVQKAGGKWDRERLNYFNGLWIRRLSDDELLARLEPFLPPEWDRTLVRRVVPMIKERMQTLAEAKDQIAFLFTDRLEHDRSLLVPKKHEPGDTVTALSRVTVALRFLEPFADDRIEQAIAAVAADVGWTVRDLTIGIRAAVTGRKVGPPLYGSIALLGKERTLERLEAAQELIAI